MSTITVDDRGPWVGLVFNAGDWFYGGTANEYDETTTGTNALGATMQFIFTGTSVKVFGTLSASNDPSFGGPDPQCTFTIDGDASSAVSYTGDLTDSPQYNVEFYSSGKLDNGQHTLLMTTNVDKAFIWVDYLKFVGESQSTSASASDSSRSSHAAPSSSHSSSVKEAPSSSADSPSKTPTSPTITPASKSSSSPVTSSSSSSSSSSAPGTTSFNPAVTGHATSSFPSLISSSATSSSSQATNSSASNSTSGHKVNTTTTIVGIVAGLIAFLIIAAAIFFYLRRRRKKQDAMSRSVPPIMPFGAAVPNSGSSAFLNDRPATYDFGILSPPQPPPAFRGILPASKPPLFPSPSQSSGMSGESHTHSPSSSTSGPHSPIPRKVESPYPVSPRHYSAPFGTLDSAPPVYTVRA